MPAHETPKGVNCPRFFYDHLPSAVFESASLIPCDFIQPDIFSLSAGCLLPAVTIPLKIKSSTTSTMLPLTVNGASIKAKF